MNYKNLALALIGLVLLFLVIKRMNVDIAVLFAIKNPIYLLFALLTMLFAFLFSTLRMNAFLSGLGEERKALRKLAVIDLISTYVYTIAPFKIHLLPRALMLTEIGVNKRNALSAVTFEYSVDVGLTITLALAGAYVFFGPLLGLSTLRYGALIIFLLVIIFIIFQDEIYTRLQKKKDNVGHPLVRQSMDLVLKIFGTLTVGWRTLVGSRETYSKVMPLSIGLILMNIMLVEFLFLSYDRYVPLVWVAAVFYSSIFISGLSNIPGGIGVREATITALFSILGVSVELAFSVSILTRLLSLLPVFFGYVLSLNVSWSHLLNKTLRG